MKLNYENLKEWQAINHIRNIDLAEEARKRGLKITPTHIGRCLAEGRPFDGAVIMAWQKAFGWTDQETMYFCLGGDIPQPEKERPQLSIMISVDDLIELAKERSKA